VFQPVSAVADPNYPKAIREDLGPKQPATMFSSVAHGQLWRLVTPIFLHGDVIHLLFNLTWIYALGRLIEARKGTAVLLMLVVGSAVISNCCEALWGVYRRDNGFTTFGGFSGVNYALFGYCWIKGRFQPYELIGVNQQTVGLMLAWLVLCMVGIFPNVANAAHLGGLVVGVAAAYWPTLRRRMAAR
jgi:GlpG protein